MEGGVKIEGFAQVLANLNKEILKIEGFTVTGLEFAAAEIRYDMDKTPPLIPVGKTGHLRSSWFTSTFKTLKGPGLVMGFSENYAVYVHEMVDAIFKRPGAGAKFFEASIKRNKEKVLRLIRDNVKIKK